MDRELRIDDQHERRLHHQRQRDQVGHRVVGKILVERDVDRHGRARRHHQRVAVRRRLGDRARRDDAAGARPVLDHEGLAEPLLELLPEHAGEDVGAAAGRERNHDGDRPRRIILGGGRMEGAQRPARSDAKHLEQAHEDSSRPFAPSRAAVRCRASSFDERSIIPIQQAGLAHHLPQRTISPSTKRFSSSGEARVDRNEAERDEFVARCARRCRWRAAPRRAWRRYPAASCPARPA